LISVLQRCTPQQYLPENICKTHLDILLLKKETLKPMPFNFNEQNPGKKVYFEYGKNKELISNTLQKEMQLT